MAVKHKVRFRGGFSDRMKIQPENSTIQLYDFDERSRTAIINTLDLSFYLLDISEHPDTIRKKQGFLRDILREVYVLQIAFDAEYSSSSVKRIVFDTVRDDSYDAVLTVIEYLIPRFQDILPLKTTRLTNLFNGVFEDEYIGYRFIDDKIVPITDEHEIAAIEEASQITHNEVAQHISKALVFLSDRDTPDYANSIKESISAVERMCSIIIGAPTTLGAALKQLEGKDVVIHPSLKLAFEKLYGYTSDGSGLRHAGQLGGADATFEEAKFMLVACSAFINYLKGIIAKHP